MNSLFPLFQLPRKSLSRVDLSAARSHAEQWAIWEFDVLEAVIGQEMARSGAAMLWGGYLEERRLYSGTTLFDSNAAPRDMHLGIDFWAAAGRPVYAPWDGVLHSQQDNAQSHDYGPTVIIRHNVSGEAIHALYGHLSRPSLALHRASDTIAAGTCIGWLGAPHENVGWVPHLHFQLIRDLEGKSGDYPGVASKADLAHYAANCPNPALWLPLP